jgi:hypothetical protein
LLELENYSTIVAILAMSFVFPTTSFLIEILAARGIPDFFVSSNDDYQTFR